MKYSVLILLLAIIATANCKLKHEALLKAIGKFLKASFDHTTNCMESTGATEDSIAKFWDHEYTGENDKALHCYLNCAYFKTGIVDEKGALLVDELMNKNGVVHQIVSHNPLIIDKLNEFCKEPKTTDVCLAAYELTQCGFKWMMATS